MSPPKAPTIHAFSDGSPLARALTGAAPALWEWDLGDDALTLSPAAAELVGCSGVGEPLTAGHWLAGAHRADQGRLYDAIAKAVDGRSDTMQCEYRQSAGGGTHRWLRIEGRALRDASGAVTHLAGAIHDVSRPREHDPLTGLPNRALFASLLAHALDEPHPVAVLCLGLDGLGRVTEVYGPEARDRLVRDTAEHLCRFSSDADEEVRLPAQLELTVAHVGPGVFTVMCRHFDRDTEVDAIAATLQRSLSRVVRLDAWCIRTTVSVGIRLAPTAPTSAGELIRDAQGALQVARRSESGRHQFDERMRAAAERVMSLEAELHNALDQDEFELHFQPVVSLGDGRVVGAEALVRWRSGVHGMVSPGEFIPIAERSGIIVPLGEWILRRACERCAAWRQDLGLDVHVAVNVSALQLRQDGFVGLVGRVLRETGLPSEALNIELTESAFVGNECAAADILGQLKAMGLTILLDDFGTGFSSLAYLQRLPIDVLKIDRAFVSGIGLDAQATALTRTIVAMAQALDLQVVAEGIETLPQERFLRDLRCEFVQGYLYAKPLPEVDFIDRVHAASSAA